MTCPHCLRLSARLDIAKAETRALQVELGLRAENGALGAMMTALGVTPTETLLLALLRAARGRCVSIAFILASTSIPNGANVKVHVMRLRKKLGAGAVLSTRGMGYALSESGLRIVESAMRVDCT